MVEAVKEFFTKYATFNGRTSRKDFWLAILGLFIISFIIGFIGGFISGFFNIDTEKSTTIISGIFSLIILIPSIAIEVRRLHDINKSGWYLLLCLIPIIGSLILLVFYCLPAVDEGNNY